MGKMNELKQTLDELTACGESLRRAVSILKELCCEAPEQKKYTYAEVRKACSGKSNAGYTEQVKALIGKYGDGRLSGVKETDYEALMAELEVIR